MNNMKTANTILPIIVTFLFFGCIENENPEIIESLLFQQIDKNTMPIDPLIYRDYNSIKEINIDEYVFEDFNSSNGNWPIINSDKDLVEYFEGFGTFRDDERYRVINNTNASNYINVEISDLNDLDFEIEYDFERSNHIYSLHNYVGFYWGSDDLNENYYIISRSQSAFVNNNNQQISIVDAEKTTPVLWYEEDVNNSFINRKMTIRRINDKYFFYINENLIFEHDFKSLYGNNVGLHMGGKGEVFIDNFKIRLLVNL